MNFIWIDWLTVIVFLVLTTGVALVTRRLISDYNSFLLAGRTLKLYLAMATMAGGPPAFLGDDIGSQQDRVIGSTPAFLHIRAGPSVPVADAPLL